MSEHSIFWGRWIREIKFLDWVLDCHPVPKFPINMNYKTVKRQKNATRQAVCLAAKSLPKEATCN